MDRSCWNLRLKVPTVTILFSVCLFLLYLASDQHRFEVAFLSASGPRVHEKSNPQSNQTIAGRLPRGWPHLKERLCPLGVPNTTLGEPLFALAREAMFGNRTRKTWNSTHNSDLVKQFYHGFFDNKEAMSLYMDENVTLAYVRIYKCGNNFIRGYEKAAARRMNRTGAGLFRKGVNPYESAEILKSHESESKCILTAIRDPISHFLSGYNEIEYRIRSNELYPKANRPPDFLSIPYDDETDRTRRFEQFVADILTQRWNRFKGLGPLHFASMSRVLSALDQQSLALTNYLPSLEDLSRAWPAFVQRECPQVPDAYFQFPSPDESLGSHNSSRDEVGFYKAAKGVWNHQGNTAKALCLIHAMDYACWDRLPDGIPRACVAAFNEKSFRDAILG